MWNRQGFTNNACLRLPVEHGCYGVMVRGEEFSFMCTIDLRIQYAKMVGDQDPIDVRRFPRLRFAKGMKGGFILLVGMDLPKGVDQRSLAGQKVVGGGILVGIEVAGNDERGLLADLIGIIAAVIVVTLVFGMK